jgi:hypothetical protein
LVHFGLDTVDLVEVSAVVCNERGTGSAKYPPQRLFRLLVHRYAT